MQNNTQYIQEDKIYLRELFSILKKRKKLILGVTVLFTLLAVIYAFNAKAIYQGQALIEIGEVVNENQVVNDNHQKTIISLDNINNLKNIVIQAKKIDATVPKNTNNLLILTSNGSDIEEINIHIQTAIDYILQRHKDKIKLYKGSNAKVRMTQTIGNIIISDKPIKPKKMLITIVAFITGLMFSIFLAFFIEFLQGIKEEEKEEV
ncbi:capsular polysaccharide biosynthesis protein [Sulfurovum sp. TSL6]|uniref:Wzz/FepE/Etk N-terminal domain-containing protein n=1 Tax=Sulfurovum sp. TSL6 TaxID=2826995 RepID=UPI001CC3A231|nr:Wzz/FepE/Etk N-terminal domain-containing protein [Sulfurovum sp. TSL6]GIU00850.1 capsular polysaccharide biosynthesis protein [Sulfurovum sp. TSL6]